MRLRFLGALALLAARPPRWPAGGRRGRRRARVAVRRRADRVLTATQALFDGYVARRQDARHRRRVRRRRRARPMFVAAGKHRRRARRRRRRTPTRLWRVYSMTKPITGMAAMILVEEGKLKLDQPISDFIPAFKDDEGADRSREQPRRAAPPRGRSRSATCSPTPPGSAISIVTTGPLLKEYERLGILPGAVNAALEARGAQGAARRRSRNSPNRVATLPLIADPGTKWSYSIGLDVLGARDRGGERHAVRPLRPDAHLRAARDEVELLARCRASEAGAAGDQLYVRRRQRACRSIPAASSVFLDAAELPLWRRRAGDVGARLRPLPPHAAERRHARRRARDEARDGRGSAMSNLLPAGRDASAVLGAAPAAMRRRRWASARADRSISPTCRAARARAPMAGAARRARSPGSIRRGKLRGTVMVNYFPAEQWPLRAGGRRPRCCRTRRGFARPA